MSPQEVLEKTFGYTTFRQKQLTIINELLDNQSQLVIMPTGGGKSLCYQIPALIKDGTAIVVSPLIALMEDQVLTLKNLGVDAACYHSLQNEKESEEVLAQLFSHELKLLYVSHERLTSKYFLKQLTQNLNISLFAIDEAHCISEWGHEFRPEYRRLNLLRQTFPNIPICAVTATAEKNTQQDIILRLNLPNHIHHASYYRTNLKYTVLNKLKAIEQIQKFLYQHKNESGIIYCATRKSVEALSTKLQALNIKALPYHGGLDEQERNKAFLAFKHDKIDIVVATSAFGMGIDKPNIRFVIHYHLPKSIEQYYQETGRAGRDGLSSDLLLLYQYSDTSVYEYFMSQLTDQEQIILQQSKLSKMIDYAESIHCRQSFLLQYFEEDTKGNCNNCDNCLKTPELVDKTTMAQKILSCIYRANQQYGSTHIINILKGSKNKKIRMLGHDKLSTYGLLATSSNAEIAQTIGQLLQQQLLVVHDKELRVLQLTLKSRPLLKNQAKFMALPLTQFTHQKEVLNIPQYSDGNHSLLTELKKLRTQISKTKNIAPFMVFSDLTLHDICTKMPQTLDELETVSGIGEYKLKHYGKLLLTLLSKYNDTEPASDEVMTLEVESAI